jgi:hypothetical protein
VPRSRSHPKHVLLLSLLLLVWLGFGHFAHAQIPVDRQITIQPILVSDGTNVANSSGVLHEAAVNKIWAQAGIYVQFLRPVIYTNASFYNLSSGTITSSALRTLSNTPGAGQNTNQNIINMWFVNLIDGNQNIAGFSLQSVPSPSLGFTVTINGISIAKTTFTRNDVSAIAHEIGHAMGLDHFGFGATGQTNLMSSTSIPPAGIADIYPDGKQFGRLTPEQIAQARSLTLASPYIFLRIADPRLAVVRDSSGVKVGIDVFTNGTYQIFASTNATGLNWTGLDVLTITNHLDWVDTNAVTGPMRFYRLRKQ